MAALAPRTVRDGLVVLVALHSVAISLVLLFAPAWAASFGGWGEASPLFFVRQGGAFHLVVALGYLAELRRYGTVRLLLLAKGLAVAFLGGLWLAGEEAWSVPLSALGDAAMGLAVLWAQARLTGSPSSS